MELILRRIRDTIRKAKKSLECIDGEWWNFQLCLNLELKRGRLPLAMDVDNLPTISVHHRKNIIDH